MAELSVPTMSASVLRAPRRVELTTVPVPEPGVGQVRIRLEGCGVCASNLGPWHGAEWFTYPFAPGGMGHEGWGVVDAVGVGVETISVGQRVASLSQAAYAQFDVADAANVVPLPPELDGRPFPAEPLACAVNIAKRSGIERGQTVAIVGLGFLGALLTQMAADAGARVIAIGRRPFALDVARRMGAAETVLMDDHWRIVETVKGLTNGRLCPVVIEATGKQWPLDLAGELTGERGRLVIAGYHQDGPRQVNMQTWNWKGLDVINAHERDPAVYAAGMREAVALAAAGRLRADALFTHRMPLAKLNEALRLTDERPDGFLKALVVM